MSSTDAERPEATAGIGFDPADDATDSDLDALWAGLREGALDEGGVLSGATGGLGAVGGLGATGGGAGVGAVASVAERLAATLRDHARAHPEPPGRLVAPSVGPAAHEGTTWPPPPPRGSRAAVAGPPPPPGTRPPPPPRPAPPPPPHGPGAAPPPPPPAPPPEYLYAEEGDQFGPVSEPDLRAWLAAGVLPETVLVWTAGWPAWRPATALRRPATGRFT